MIQKLYAQATTRAVRYEAGLVTNPTQADAAVAVSHLEQRAAQAGQDMMVQDNKEFDLNQPTLNNVYLHSANPSGYTGHCVRDDQGQLERLEAGNGKDQFSVSVDGDRKEVRQTTVAAAAEGESPIVTEEWAVFNGPSVKYKKISYPQ